MYLENKTIIILVLFLLIFILRKNVENYQAINNQATNYQPVNYNASNENDVLQEEIIEDEILEEEIEEELIADETPEEEIELEDDLDEAELDLKKLELVYKINNLNIKIEKLLGDYNKNFGDKINYNLDKLKDKIKETSLNKFQVKSESINNLSKIADGLINSDTLEIPGDFQILGKIKVNGSKPSVSEITNIDSTIVRAKKYLENLYENRLKNGDMAGKDIEDCLKNNLLMTRESQFKNSNIINTHYILNNYDTRTGKKINSIPESSRTFKKINNNFVKTFYNFFPQQNKYKNSMNLIIELGTEKNDGFMWLGLEKSTIDEKMANNPGGNTSLWGTSFKQSYDKYPSPYNFSINTTTRAYKNNSNIFKDPTAVNYGSFLKSNNNSGIGNIAGTNIKRSDYIWSQKIPVINNNKFDFRSIMSPPCQSENLEDCLKTKYDREIQTYSLPNKTYRKMGQGIIDLNNNTQIPHGYFIQIKEGWYGYFNTNNLMTSPIINKVFLWTDFSKPYKYYESANISNPTGKNYSDGSENSFSVNV
tara:strand:+ start:1074 stop:2681 length:1608 start_codon:yes stop_codon:yes gene_type:complete